MTRTITPVQEKIWKIWADLRSMGYNARAAIDDWSNINFTISEAFSSLSPLSALEIISDDTIGLEKHLIDLEAAAEIAEDRLASLRRHIQKIDTILNEIKEAKND